ncbi:unnamed protein product [Gongylonema pulchrum]|uniref:glucuronosyltransferase n=1 Tax=Gongylonema pulchrum TaxID=637853 RepID=A0A183DQ51_9BILA|nr:unnamed protein product [Gongylonema pulchrum]
MAWEYVRRTPSLSLHTATLFSGQSELSIYFLGHPNLRAFVSHCGQNSLTEAVHQGVPLVCVPLFGDQKHNAQKAVKRNIAVCVDKSDLSPNALIHAFRKVLHDTTYRKSSERLSEMIRHKPFSSRERLLRHVDFASKFGPIDSFDIAANDLSFVQYYLLDIIIPLLLLVALIVFLSLQFLIFAIRKVLVFPKTKSD